MPGQTTQEFERYADRALCGLEQLGNFLAKKAEELASHLDKVVLPKVEGKVKNVLDTFSVHGEVTFRRTQADIEKLTLTPEELQATAIKNFEAVKGVISRRVDRSAAMRGFLQSGHAKLVGFDNSNVEAKGIAVFPRAEMLGELKRDFLPFRILLTAEGLKSRTYRRNEALLGDPTRPTYIYSLERSATANDLQNFQIAPEDVELAFRYIRKSEPYKKYLSEVRAASRKEKAEEKNKPNKEDRG